MKWMKLVLIALILSSCGQIYFKEPMPQKGTTVKSFVDEIQGIYQDSLLKVEIYKKSLVISGEKFELTKKIPGNGEVLVKYYRDFYFASFADSSYFQVYMVKFYDDNKLALYMLNADESSRKRIARFTKVETIDDSKQAYLLEPTKKEFSELVDYGMFEVFGILEK